MLKVYGEESRAELRHLIRMAVDYPTLMLLVSLQFLRGLREPQEIQRRAEGSSPLEEVYKDFTVSTDPEVHVKALQEAFKGGATEVHIHSGQADQRRVIEFYGKEVLPRLRKGHVGKAA
jgi:hypothetical protein